MSLLLAILLIAPQETITQRLMRGERIRLPQTSQETAAYGDCLLERFRAGPRPSPADALAACAEVRAAAAAAADAALAKKRRFRDPVKRRAQVEETLGSYEQGVALLHGAFPAPPPPAASRPALNNEQAAIVYDQCLARAAGKASRTDAPPDSIYGMARTACADTRAMLTAGGDSSRTQILDSIDAERAASFPARTKQFREMMRQAGVPPEGPKR